MSWPFTSTRTANLTVDSILADSRGRRISGVTERVSREQALRMSATWACLRLRADLVSTMPLDTFRTVQGVQVEVPKSPVFVTPGGDSVDMQEHLYSSQFDLDSSGNTVGLITEVDGYGLPRRIDLQPISDVTVRVVKGALEYQIGSKVHKGEQLRYIWHEKQFTTSGSPVGLSPIAYAAMTLNGSLSAQEFAAHWFANGVTPAAHLKNTAKTLKGTQADAVKERFRSSLRDGDVFVSGNDWEYSMLSAKASESSYIEQLKLGVPDVCRYLGVPGDMIDAESSTGHVTYANVTQRNLQLLIMNLNPTLKRREAYMTRRLLPGQRFAKFNRGALLEMDLKSRYEAHEIAIRNRFETPDEARELENRPPLTSEQVAQFDTLFPPKMQGPNTGGQPA